MVDKLVLGFEWFMFPRTLLPVASMVSLFWSSNMIDGQMSHHIVQRWQHLPTALASILVDPLAGHFLVSVHVFVAEER